MFVGHISKLYVLNFETFTSLRILMLKRIFKLCLRHFKTGNLQIKMFKILEVKVILNKNGNELLQFNPTYTGEGGAVQVLNKVL